jgi:multiple sugar transport system permease protein
MAAEPIPLKAGAALQTRTVQPPWLVRARPYLVILPSLIILIGILYPFFMAFYYSFTSYTLTRPIPRFTGLTNYILLVKDPNFLHSTLVTFGYALISTGVELLLGMISTGNLCWRRCCAPRSSSP